MMRLIVAAIAANDAMAGNKPDMIKELAAQAFESQPSLVDRHHKGNEQRHRTLASRRVELTDEQRTRVQSRMLKRDRSDPDSSKKKTASESTEKGGEETATDDSDNLKTMAKTPSDSKPGGHHIPAAMTNVHLSAAHGKTHKTASTFASPISGGSYSKTSKASPPPPSSPPSPSSPVGGKTDKGGKSRKVSSAICAKRLAIAFEEMISLDPDGDGPFGIVTTPADVTGLCRFVAPSVEGEDFNFGCPFLYVPDFGFIEGEGEYVAILGEEAGKAFQSFVMYCQCHQGLELGCASKVPHGPSASTKQYINVATFQPEVVTVNSYSEYMPFGTPASRADYCKMVGVWNGDFGPDTKEDFSPDVTDCGCYFIGQAKDMVDQCPGVDLGAFFTLPPAPSIAPTLVSNNMPTATIPAEFPIKFPTEIPTE